MLFFLEDGIYGFNVELRLKDLYDKNDIFLGIN